MTFQNPGQFFSEPTRGAPARLSAGDALPRSRKVFVARNLRMEDVDLVGFDMDHTLALYRPGALYELSVHLTIEKLVGRGYPAAIRDVEYTPEWAMRGTVVDSQLGNVFKMDFHGFVGRVFHGTRELPKAERIAAYRQERERIRLSNQRFFCVDSLFDPPGAVIYIRLVDFFEGRGGTDWARLWNDIHECLDEAHRDGTLKQVICADLGRFFDEDPDLPIALHHFRAPGRRLFLLTNSLYDYTDTVMRHLLDGRLPNYPSWRDYFDFVVAGGAKPGFFTGSAHFIRLDPATGDPLGVAQTFEGGGVYQGGNLADFERMSGTGGERILYVGDHIYGDVMRPKKASVWRTALVVQELEVEIEVTDRVADQIQLVEDLSRQRTDVEAEIHFREQLPSLLSPPGRDAIEGLRLNGTVDGISGLDPIAGLAANLDASPVGNLDIDQAVSDEIEDLEAHLAELSLTIDRLESEIDSSYSPHWGPIFKEGNELSRFGQQVDSFACLYSSRVSNFLAYSPTQYFRTPRSRMPHEVG